MGTEGPSSLPRTPSTQSPLKVKLLKVVGDELLLLLNGRRCSLPKTSFVTTDKGPKLLMSKQNLMRILEEEEQKSDDERSKKNQNKADDDDERNDDDKDDGQTTREGTKSDTQNTTNSSIGSFGLDASQNTEDHLAGCLDKAPTVTNGDCRDKDNDQDEESISRINNNNNNNSNGSSIIDYLDDDNRSESRGSTDSNEGDARSESKASSRSSGTNDSSKAGDDRSESRASTGSSKSDVSEKVERNEQPESRASCRSGDSSSDSRKEDDKRSESSSSSGGIDDDDDDEKRDVRSKSRSSSRSGSRSGTVSGKERSKSRSTSGRRSSASRATTITLSPTENQRSESRASSAASGGSDVVALLNIVDEGSDRRTNERVRASPSSGSSSRKSQSRKRKSPIGAVGKPSKVARNDGVPREESGEESDSDSDDEDDEDSDDNDDLDESEDNLFDNGGCPDDNDAIIISDDEDIADIDANVAKNAFGSTDDDDDDVTAVGDVAELDDDVIIIEERSTEKRKIDWSSLVDEAISNAKTSKPPSKLLTQNDLLESSPFVVCQSSSRLRLLKKHSASVGVPCSSCVVLLHPDCVVRMRAWEEVTEVSKIVVDAKKGGVFINPCDKCLKRAFQVEELGRLGKVAKLDKMRIVLERLPPPIYSVPKVASSPEKSLVKEIECAVESTNCKPVCENSVDGDGSGHQEKPSLHQQFDAPVPILESVQVDKYACPDSAVNEKGNLRHDAKMDLTTSSIAAEVINVEIKMTEAPVIVDSRLEEVDVAPSNSASPVATSTSASPAAPSYSASPVALSNLASPVAPSNLASPVPPSNLASPFAPPNLASPFTPPNSASPFSFPNFALPVAALTSALPVAPPNSASPSTSESSLLPSNSLLPVVPDNSASPVLKLPPVYDSSFRFVCVEGSKVVVQFGGERLRLSSEMVTTSGNGLVKLRDSKSLSVRLKRDRLDV